MAGNARLFVAALMLAAGLAQAQETLRPEIGKPLQAAQELLKEGKYKDALGKVREADAVSDRTPYENYILPCFGQRHDPIRIQADYTGDNTGRRCYTGCNGRHAAAHLRC